MASKPEKGTVMTDREAKIQQNVEKTLEAFTQTKRITPDPWFCQRVMGKIQSCPASTPSLWALFSLQWLKPALLIVMVILNLTLVVKAYQQSSQEAHANYVASFVSDYGYANMDDMFTVNE